MSNDKVAATFSGGETTCCWMGRHTGGEDHVKMCANYQTTGEHTKAKIEDYLYDGVHPKTSQFGMISGREASEKSAWAISQLGSQFGAVPGAPADPRPKYQNAYMRDLGPALRKAPAPWTPSGRQLAVAGVIAAVIIVLLGWLLLSL